MKRLIPLLLLTSCGAAPAQGPAQRPGVSERDRELQQYILNEIKMSRVVCINGTRYLASRLSSGVVFTVLAQPGSTVTAAHCTGKEFVNAKVD